MRFVGILLLAAAALPGAFADEVHSYDFRELPEGWTADPEWSFDATGAHVAVSVSSGGPPVSNRAEMSSGDGFLLMPEGTDSVAVLMECSHSFDGGYYSGEASAMVYATAILDGETHAVVLEYESWGFPGDGTDALYSTSFGASEGDTLSFELYASASAYSGWAEAAWDIESMTVTVYGAASLAPGSWGAVKAGWGEEG